MEFSKYLVFLRCAVFPATVSLQSIIVVSHSRVEKIPKVCWLYVTRYICKYDHQEDVINSFDSSSPTTTKKELVAQQSFQHHNHNGVHHNRRQRQDSIDSKFR